MESCLIVLILAAMAHAAPQYLEYAVPTILPDGHLADTPEVTAAKLAHFHEHARALASDPDIAAPVVSHLSAPDAVAAAPAAVAPVDTVIRTGASPYFANYVAAAPAAVAPVDPVIRTDASPYFANYVAAAPASVAPVDTVIRTDASSYFANPVITPEGFVADTAEVSRAKAIHYAAHAAARGAPIEPYLKYLDLYA